ncbi:3-hydroxyacyl-CoA dehydrogenase family protein [Gottfriedia sp. NPDC058432]|uniref:3-hydroxyacyl-CoA dehydrogenase family protein n=1 Tax=Gottfriedia sp. NPDC058432 TaxID=3346497 RepID=UPI0036697972
MSQLLLKQFNKVVVVGSGLMGSGIAQVAAQNGFQVTLVDQTVVDLERGMHQIRTNLLKLFQSEKINESQMKRTLDNIYTTTELKDAQYCDVAIEAVPEKLEIKQQIFKELDAIMPEHAILASNTSSLSIAAIGSVTTRPDKVVGMHFFSPVPKMKLVEIVRSVNTSDETLQVIREIGERLQKQIIIANDYPGFTVNRVLVPMLNEAAFLVMEGNEVEEIDKGMMLGANHPIGPLRLSDYVGIDVLLFTLESLYEGFNDSKYRPCPLLKRMVEAGHLGKKSGKGFYKY